VDRLSGAASAGVIADHTRNDLVDAFRLLWRVRLEHHAERVEWNARPDDFVDPGSLPPVTLAALGASLRVIADAQAGLAKEQGLGRRRG
jgi:signal-transduction protein with cAMP-binding, CBS, and nucleotidyltransferase domain